MARYKGLMGLMLPIKMLLITAVPAVVCLPSYALEGMVISKGMEFRYYSSSQQANGETDFKGETEVFGTDQRIEFLNAYTDFMSVYFNNPDLDTKAVGRDQIQTVLRELKPQPLTKTRQTLRLKDWKSLGFREGQIAEEKVSIARWTAYANASIVNEHLTLATGCIDHKLNDPMNWRFSFKWKASVSQNGNASFALSGTGGSALETGLTNEGHLYCRYGLEKVILRDYDPGTEIQFEVEVDLENRDFNLYLDDERVLYAVSLMDKKVSAVDTFSITSSGQLNVDDILGIDFVRDTKNVNVPFSPRVTIDQNFSLRPDIKGWEKRTYDDSRWETITLPAVHGGFRCAGEHLYLRKTVSLDDYEKAILTFETLDPGGDIFVNGIKVASIPNRWPVRLNVTKYLNKHAENQIGVMVNSFKLDNPMHHTCADPHIGWFAGRCQLELSSSVSIQTALVNTEMLDGSKAIQCHSITFENKAGSDFYGKVKICYSPWMPKEAAVCLKKEYEIYIPEGKSIERDFYAPLENALIWTFKTPNLYKVQVQLKDSKGKKVDDYVLTTGVRTISQKGGTFRINGKEEVLNGVQNMGFRMPVETLAVFNRCAPLEILVEEILMAKKCSSNMLRIHVHAAKDMPDGIHDPRIAELCDQLGMMLVWSGGAWIREGNWKAIDFEGMSYYMEPLYNHPSIVVWELSNHPNTFKSKPLQYSIDFVEKTMRTALAIDTSRLISPTTYWQHTLIKNDLGTEDIYGNEITMPVEYTHPACTRGTQDAVTGYGADWSKLRRWPTGWSKDCLENKQRAFFNWEHEESIAQPNWNLSKGKPWHELQSYEHFYDKGSIGRKLQANQWRASQGFQAFSAYESMKKQRLLGVAGFSWCCLRGGPNSGTYKKPLIDSLGHPKLAWYIHKLVYQRVLAGSDNVDVVYGPDDTITPVIMNLDEAKNVDLTVRILDPKKNLIKEFSFVDISLDEGRSTTKLSPLKINLPEEGFYAIEYLVVCKGKTERLAL